MKNSHTQVIIIGAGSVGLLSAVHLAKSGIKFRIFEKRQNISNLSKALAIHSGTLEYLEEFYPDLLQEFLQKGRKIKYLKFGEKYQLNLNIIASKYNFVLALEQSQTEAILENYLEKIGVKVERNCCLISLQNNQNEVICSIKSASEEFKVRSQYLLDCSGAHSIIRKDILKMPFEGEKYFGHIVMGDVKLNSNINNNSAQIIGSNKGLAALLPLTKSSYFRVILIPHFDAKIPQEISMDYFLNLAKIIVPQIDLEQENNWLTSFEISKRVVKKLRIKGIFLAGDAAHIHSPVGGQGMNLGMQDSFNICYKLKRVLIDGADNKILDNYQKERMPIIKDVLKTTNIATKSGVENSFISALLSFMIEKVIAPIFFNSKFLQKKLVTKISQIKSARKEIYIIKNQ
jgi:2-polyprenyl-6-methoxyphenol hydroxylase-like FAD-dependent oxidoreductase